MKIECLFKRKSTYQEVTDRAKHKPENKKYQQRRERQRNQKAMTRKSTCQEVKDRVKHKPIKQKVPVKKGKTEK